MAEKTTKKKRVPKKVKEAMVEAKMNEVEQAAKEYQEEHKPDINEEFPPIALPCRGYFKELDHGLDVQNLQLMLNRVVLTNLEIDGEYGEKTMEAVKEFETKYGGVVNGKFGHEELVIYNKMRGID